jgi:hypothetical protein
MEVRLKAVAALTEAIRWNKLPPQLIERLDQLDPQIRLQAIGLSD